MFVNEHGSDTRVSSCGRRIGNTRIRRRTNAIRKPTPCGPDNFEASTRTGQFDAPATATDFAVPDVEFVEVSNRNMTIVGYRAVISSPNGVRLLHEPVSIVI